jgi:hypothetical protein
MDPFATLPVPILETILGLCPDLQSLDELRKASPTVASILREEGVLSPILENIISRSETRHMRVLIRTLVLLRWRCLACSSPIVKYSLVDNPLPDVWEGIGGFSYQFSDHWPGPDTFGGIPLPKSVPPPILCSLLAVSSRIQNLTHSCIRDFHARCMMLKPSHLADPEFVYNYRYFFSEWEPPPAGQRYTPQDVTGSSRYERQRVLSSLWRIVLYFELLDYLETGCCEWDPFTVERLKVNGLGNFWSNHLWHGEMAQLMSVGDWLASEPQQWAISGREKVDERKMKFSLLSAVLDIDRGRFVCRSNLEEEQWRPIEELTESESPGCESWREGLTGNPRSPLKHIDFDVFRPYGFALWDSQRMAALGFLADPIHTAGVDVLSQSNIMFTWMSILPEYVLKYFEERMKGGDCVFGNTGSWGQNGRYILPEDVLKYAYREERR